MSLVNPSGKAFLRQPASLSKLRPNFFKRVLGTQPIELVPMETKTASEGQMRDLDVKNAVLLPVFLEAQFQIRRFSVALDEMYQLFQTLAQSPKPVHFGVFKSSEVPVARP